MRTIIGILAIAISVQFSFGQKINENEVPATVKSTFKSNYPDISNVKWEKENSEYEASFEQNAIETSVVIDARGTLIETETAISDTELPDAIKNYITTNLSGKKIKEAAKIVRKDGRVRYEAEVENVDYIFDETGKLLNTESETQDEDND